VKEEADKGGKPAKELASGVLLYTRYGLGFVHNRLERMYISFIFYDDFFNNILDLSLKST
jgi:hypothetical protein